MASTASDAGVSLSVQVTGADAVGRALVGLQVRLADLHPVLDEIGAAMVGSTQRRFEEERGPDGKPWRLLSAETVLARAGGRAKVYTKRGAMRKGATRRIGATAILRDSARLYQSITHRATRTEVEVGTDAVYGRIHQLGGQAGRGKTVTIPARPFLGMSDGDVREALEIVNDYIRGVLP